MLARGYKKDLALGCICAGGGLSTLIPPSVVFILYGLTAGVSIGQLYIAGIIPGLMLAAPVHRLHRDPRLARTRRSRRARCRWRRRCRSRQKVALLRQAVPALAGGLRGPRFAVPGLGDADRGRRRRRGRRGAGGAGQAPAQLAGGAPRDHRNHPHHRDAVLAVLRLVGADRRLHAGRRHVDDPGLPRGLPARADRRAADDPGGLDRPRLLHRLDRHPAADRADLRAGGGQARLRPGLAGGAVLHEHADLLHLAAVRPCCLLPQGRHAARHHADRHLQVDLALPGAAGAGAGASSSPSRRSPCGCRRRWAQR